MDDPIFVGATVDIQLQVVERLATGLLAPVDVSALTVTYTLLGPYVPGQPQVRLPGKAAANLTDGTDGWTHYTTLTTDLSVAGQWQVQALASGVGKNYPCAPVPFTVRANL